MKKTNLYLIQFDLDTAFDKVDLIEVSSTNSSYLGKLQKINFFSGPATKALPPHPSSLVATFLREFFFELTKKFFFLSCKAIKLFLRLPLRILKMTLSPVINHNERLLGSLTFKFGVLTQCDCLAFNS